MPIAPYALVGVEGSACMVAEEEEEEEGDLDGRNHNFVFAVAIRRPPSRQCSTSATLPMPV